MKRLGSIRIAAGILCIFALSGFSIKAQDSAHRGKAAATGSLALASPAASSNITGEDSSGQSTPSKDSPYRLKRGDNEFGFWGGGAFKATTIFGGLRKDEARDRRFLIAAFRYGRTLATNRRLALQYTLDAIPLAIATGNIVQSTTVTTAAGTTTTFRRETSYGAGLTPLGLQLDFANRARIKPFIHVNGGALIFSKPVPFPDAGKFAFTGETGGGVRVFTSERRAVNLGVRFHHISNGNRTGGANRGLNEFIFYAGFSVFK